MMNADSRVHIELVDDGKANALTVAVVDQLLEAVRRAIANQQVLVIAGRPGYFSAGFDLGVMTSDDDQQKRDLMAAGAQLFTEMLGAPIPVIAACTGHALAAGALLLLSSDWRVGGRQTAKIGLNEVAIGLPLPKFALTLARHRLSPTMLTSATLFAEVAAPERAVQLGYLDEQRDDVLAGAVHRAQAAAALDNRAFAATKQRVWASLLAELGSSGGDSIEL